MPTNVPICVFMLKEKCLHTQLTTLTWQLKHNATLVWNNRSFTYNNIWIYRDSKEFLLKTWKFITISFLNFSILCISIREIKYTVQESEGYYRDESWCWQEEVISGFITSNYGILLSTWEINSLCYESFHRISQIF